MKLKLILLEYFGGLFFVKGFDTWVYLIFNKKSLEVFRTQSYFSFFSGLARISNSLFLITAPGLIGLLLAGTISFFINKKAGYNQIVLWVSFVLILITNKAFINITNIINFRSEYLQDFSVKFLLAIGALICVFVGILILLLAKHLKLLNHYLKVHS